MARKAKKGVVRRPSFIFLRARDVERGAAEADAEVSLAAVFFVSPSALSFFFSKPLSLSI